MGGSVRVMHHFYNYPFICSTPTLLHFMLIWHNWWKRRHFSSGHCHVFAMTSNSPVCLFFHFCLSVCLKEKVEFSNVEWVKPVAVKMWDLDLPLIFTTTRALKRLRRQQWSVRLVVVISTNDTPTVVINESKSVFFGFTGSWHHPLSMLDNTTTEKYLLSEYMTMGYHFIMTVNGL